MRNKFFCGIIILSGAIVVFFIGVAFGLTDVLQDLDKTCEIQRDPTTKTQGWIDCNE